MALVSAEAKPQWNRKRTLCDDKSGRDEENQRTNRQKCRLVRVSLIEFGKNETNGAVCEVWSK